MEKDIKVYNPPKDPNRKPKPVPDTATAPFPVKEGK